MTATPFPADSFGMRQIARRYSASAARLARSTRHKMGHAPVPAYVNLEPHLEGNSVEEFARLVLAPLLRILPPTRAAYFLESQSASVREAAMFAVCAQEAT